MSPMVGELGVAIHGVQIFWIFWISQRFLKVLAGADLYFWIPRVFFGFFEQAATSCPTPWTWNPRNLFKSMQTKLPGYNLSLQTES